MMPKKDIIFFSLTLVFTLVFLLMTARESNAASYSVAGNCYLDTASALVGFQAQFPQVQGTSIINLTTSSISATGLVTFVTQSRLLTTATWTTNPSSTVQLGACAVTYAASSVPVTNSSILNADNIIASAVQAIQVNTASEVAAVSSVNAHVTNIDNAVSSVITAQQLTAKRTASDSSFIAICAAVVLTMMGFAAGKGYK